MTDDALFELLSLECHVDEHGTVHYYNALGQRHRVHGPAVESTNGSYMWYQNGLLHRLDGAAVACLDGYRAWYQNGQRHRLDGPAIERPDGRREWYIDGNEVTDPEWQQAVASMEIV